MRRLRRPPVLQLLALAVAAIAAIPLYFVVSETISVGWDEAYRLIARPRVGMLFRNTVRLTAVSVLACAVIGTTAAWLVERTDLPLRRLWNVLLVAPLAIPAFVNSYAWVSVTHRVEGFGGASLIVTLSYFPLVYLPVAAALRGLDPALEETARSLGHGPAKTFARVVLPELRPALAGGMLLVALHLLAEFGALQMLRFPTFTTAIFDQYKSTFNSAAANMLASVLVLCCLVALLAEQLLRGRVRRARIGSGAARSVRRVRLRWFTPVALAGLTALVALALGVPLTSLSYWLAEGSSTSFPAGELASTTWSSVRLAGVGAAVTVALALPLAWLAVRKPGIVTMASERVTYVGHSLPGIVVALSLVTITIRHARSIYQTNLLLITAYAILFFPLAMVAIKASLEQAPPALDDAARSLGSRPLRVWRRVTLPLAAPGIGAGAALVFIAVMTELTATLLLAPIGTQTLATRFWAHSDEIAYGAAAPYAALMVLVSLPATYVLTRESRRSS
jgi:iron(III) transport system permease protein